MGTLKLCILQVKRVKFAERILCFACIKVKINNTWIYIYFMLKYPWCIIYNVFFINIKESFGIFPTALF